MGTKCPPVLPKMPWKGKTQGEPTFLQKNLPSALAMKSSSSLGSPVQGKAQGRMVEHMVEDEDGCEPGEEKAKERPCCCLQGVRKVEPDLRGRARLQLAHGKFQTDTRMFFSMRE